MIKVAHLVSDYQLLIKEVVSCVRKRKYEKALDLIDVCARIVYQYNFLPSFSDDILEKALDDISYHVIPQIQIKGNDNTILFYDYFGFDNRGLTQQFLRGLIHLNLSIVYVLEQRSTYFKSDAIFSELNEYPHAKIVILKENTTDIEKARELVSIIAEYKPLSAFMHLAPWNIVACLAFSAVKGVRRYQINLTDHAFWLGKSISDYIVEFRSFGANLSIKKREIAEEKIRILPYYPIANSIPFKGFPSNIQRKKKILSGGNYYKTLGENLKFFHLVKDILLKDDELVFLFAGSGNTQPITAFIDLYGLKDNFLLLGDREDITALLHNVDYYFSTFPLTGALMTQIAVDAGVPSYFFSTDEYPCNDLNCLFYKNNTFLQYFTNEIDFINAFISTYKDEAFLNKYRLQLLGSMITPVEFAQSLKLILEGQNPFQYLYRNVPIETYQKKLCAFFIESENSYNPQYNNLILSRFPNSTVRRNLLPQFYIREQYCLWKKSKKRVLMNLIDWSILSYMRKIKKVTFRILAFVLFRILESKEYKEKLIIKKRVIENSFMHSFKFFGQNSRLPDQRLIKNPQYISIGNNFSALYNLRIEAWDDYFGTKFTPEIIIGDNVAMNSDIHIGCIGKIRIGNNVLMASRIYISDHSHGNTSVESLNTPPMYRDLSYKGDMVIGDNVWIGEGVAILPGVCIGNNSIIGANAVVTKSIPPYSIAVGVPAKVVATVK